MSRRYFNWKLAVVLILGCAVLGATAFGIRKWRKVNSAEKRLEEGNIAYNAQDWEEAAKRLGQYIAVNQNDVDVLMKYAESLLKIRPSSANRVLQAAQAYRAVLRYEPDNLEAAKQLTQIYFLMERYGDAELISARLIENNPDPDLIRLHAIALVKQKKFQEAAEELKELCKKNPKQIIAFDTTGQLAEQRPEEFSELPVYWYNEAIKNNPSSALAYILRADFYRRNKDMKSALVDMEKAESLDLTDPSVCLRLAGEYINMELLDKAQKILAKVRESSPDNQELWQLSAQLALMSGSLEKMKDTAQTGLEELAMQPWDFMPLAAELLIRSGEYDQASECISQLNQKDFEPAIISYLEGLMNVQKGDYQNAVKKWEHSIGSGNKSVRLRLELASVFSTLGDMQSSIGQLQSLVSERPDSFEGHLALAKMYVQTGNWSQAQEQAAKAVQLEPGNSEALLLQMQTQMQISGSGSERNQNLQNIDELLSKLESDDMNTIDVTLVRIEFEMQKSNFVKAYELINQLKQNNPKEVRVFLAEAELLAAQDKISEAKDVLRQAIEKFPDAAGPVKYLASLLYTQGDKEGCAEVISEALKRIEQPLVQRDLTLLLASFYTSWNQQEKAYQQLELIEQKFPDDIPVKRRLLQCEEVYKQPDKAQLLIDEIKALEGDDGWQWRYEQARLWYLSEGFKDRYPQIVSLVQKNLLSNPDDQASRVLLAGTYDKAGETQLAIAAYREALNRSPDNIRIISALVSALYKIKEYDQADELLKNVPEKSLSDPQLRKLQLQSNLRQGQFESASSILHDLIGNDPNNQEAGLTLALIYMQQEKYNESEQLLSKLKVTNPGSLSVAAAQIQLNLKLKKTKEALKVCDDLVNNQNSISAYILRAKTYATLNQPQKAIEDLDKAIEIEPENGQAWLARSDFYSSVGIQDKSLQDIRKALSLDTKNDLIQKRAIELLLTSGKPEMIREGKNILEQALKSMPEDSELQLYKANSLLIEGTTAAIEDARQILQRISKEHPDFSQAWLMLGEIMLKKGQPGSAMDYASRGLSYKPHDEKLLYLKARAEAVRSPVLAIPTLKMLCDLNPNNIEAATFLVNIYVSTGEPSKAVSFLQNQLTMCSSFNTRTYNIALAASMYKEGNKAQAIEKLESFIDDDPNDPSPLLTEIYLLRDSQLWTELKNKTFEWYRKNPENSHMLAVIAGNLMSVDSDAAKKIAEEILRTILKNDPRYPEALYSLAILLGLEGRTEEAGDIYRKLLEIEPDNLIAINNLAWILCEDMGQPQQALDLAQKGLKVAPDYVDLIDTRGMAYFRMGQFQKALQDFAKCVELYPDSTRQDTTSRYHLAKVYAGLRENKKAIEYLKQVIDSGDKTGGLTSVELNDAKNLLKQLQEDI